MLEESFLFAQAETKQIQRVMEDDNVGINHIVLEAGDALPEHHSNSHVYLIVVRGTVSLQLDEQEPHAYAQGAIVHIPYQTKMNVSNSHQEVLEFFIVKAPSPRKMPH